MSEASRPTVTVVASGKGGVGKTTVVANLAVALARQARRVMVVDADFGLANLDLALGMSPELSLEHVLAGQCALADIAVAGPEGITLIPAGSGVTELAALPPTVLAGLMEAIIELAANYDDLILDTAAGISENVVGLFNRADRLVVVVSPDPASMVDAYATIKLAHGRGFDRTLGVVINGATDGRETDRIYRRLKQVTSRFLGIEPELLGQVPRDLSVSRALRAQRLVLDAFPLSPASLAFRRLACRMQPPAAILNQLPANASVQ